MIRLILRVAATLILCAVVNVHVSAQAAPTATGPGTSIRLGGGILLANDEYGQRWLGGTHGWLDVNLTWRIGVEAEANWLNLHQDPDRSHFASYLVGPRLVLRPGCIQPYVKFLAGAGTFEFPFGYGHGTYLAAGAGAGVELRWTRSLNVRLFDVELQDWPQFSFGPFHPYTVSTGISYRIVRGSTQPGGLRR